ncbi:uncharacterized protein PV06_11232 [Exophiala oligosperma]|uniref:Myb-like domain-containing protein n=1 Tax=Exophiala oligosperma TaxID=215243 RepID=A0A0D2A8A7_9EURO|nr:uncharacterized protein PV06_11232 [Exophiala oligosperma]KIW36521.1 hypothetical protein PV06_11232 [Exophiala oligosperma]
MVIPNSHLSSGSQLPLAQSANIMVTPKGTRQQTVSSRPIERVKRGRKRRYRSESDTALSDSRRVRVEANSNGKPSPTEGTAAHSFQKDTHLHKPGFKYGAPIDTETYNSIHRSDSEQALVDRGASVNYEDKHGPNILRGRLSTTPTVLLNDEPSNSRHKQYQHWDRLKSLSVQPVTPSDAAFITAIIDSAAELQDFFQAPAAWAVACGVQPDKLVNIALKPLANRCWLLTATVSRCASGMDLLRRGRTRSRERWSPDPDTSSDFCSSEGESDSRPTKRGQWTSEENDKLTKSRRLGEAWSWTFEKLPERSEAAVRSRWFVVPAPRMEVTKTRPV